MLKIIIISHTFIKEDCQKRWRTLAKDHSDLDITLLTPSEWEFLTGYDMSNRLTCKDFDDDNFHVRSLEIKNNKYLGWISADIKRIIEENSPDIVYHIGGHLQRNMIKLAKMKKNNKAHFKLYSFSMRGPYNNIDWIVKKQNTEKNIIKKIKRFVMIILNKHNLKIFNRYCDAVFCHYPEAVKCFRDEGYRGPIFMQTQVGFDSDLFYPDINKRRIIREKYALGDSFVFASAIRFVEGKGWKEVIQAFPQEGDWKYLLMGAGTKAEIEKIKDMIKKYNFSDKIILTGYINENDMPYYWNAADCAIHFPRTTQSWIETFSLSVVQAMGTNLPVIGSDSGSVPYQIGPDGIIVPEDDIEQLARAINKAMNSKEELKLIANKMYERAVNSFSIKHLNDLFYLTIIELNNNVINEKRFDMTNMID